MFKFEIWAFPFSVGMCLPHKEKAKFQKICPLAQSFEFAVKVHLSCIATICLRFP